MSVTVVEEDGRGVRQYEVDRADVDRYVDEYDADRNIIGTLVNYIERRFPCGDALSGLLENDLRKFMSHADRNTLNNLDTTFKFMYNVLPSFCWGSKEKVTAFLDGEETLD